MTFRQQGEQARAEASQPTVGGEGEDDAPSATQVLASPPAS